MADIQLMCASCGNTVTVSQFADPSMMTCKQCGQKLQGAPSALGQPDATKQSVRPQVRKQQPLNPAPQAAAAASGEPQQWDILESMKKEMPPPPGVSMTQAIASWSLFIVIAAASGAARYMYLIPDHIMQYGPYLVLIFVLTILLKAFKDSMFQGMLCLLVPGYAFYYLFLVCDDFYLRAVIGGLMVGLAENSYNFYSQIAIDVFVGVTKWIQSGGGG